MLQKVSTFAPANEGRRRLREFFERLHIRHKRKCSTSFFNEANRRFNLGRDTGQVRAIHSVRYFSIFAECDIYYFTMKSLILAQDER